MTGEPDGKVHGLPFSCLSGDALDWISVELRERSLAASLARKSTTVQAVRREISAASCGRSGGRRVKDAE